MCPLKLSYLHLGISAGLFVLLVLFIFVRSKKRSSKKQQEPTLYQKRKNFASSLKSLLLGSNKELEGLLPELEEILLTADAGIQTTERLISELSNKKEIVSKLKALEFIKSELQKILTPKTDFMISKNDSPFVIYMVGVNGVGKTTTIGKLASQLKAQGNTVLLIAADTFRAAAVHQLRIWSEKNQVEFIGGTENADPSSVIVDGLRSAQAKKIDIVIVDTAGRLQTKHNLMNELKKMVRMTERELGKNPDEIFLVVDAITGQNGFSQAKVFFEAIPLSGIILTKYDATSKGGIIISIVEQTGISIRYVGFGEKIDDLKKFDAKEFVEKIFGEEKKP